MTDPFLAQGRPRASEFVFARLRYDSGDWDYNPKVAANVLNSIVEYTTIRVFPEEVVISAASDDLLRRNTVGAFDPRSHELNAATRHNKRLELVATQIY